MKTLHFIIMIILFPVVALSQNLEKIGGKGEAQRNNKNEIGFFKATANLEAITDKNDFFSSVLNIAKTDEYKFEKKGDSKKEWRFELYYQFYEGVPVKNGVYVLHWENGKLESANGNYIRIDKLNPKPTLTEKEALEIWCNYQKIPASEISRSKIELFVVDLYGAEETKTESNVVLAYRIRLYSTNIRNWCIGYVDAHTGEVCLKEPIALTCVSRIANVDQNFNPIPLAASPPPPANGSFATRYNGAQSASTESRNNQFFLEDWTRGNGIITRNRNNLDAADTTGTTPFADNNNNWTTDEWDNAAKDNAALDIHWTLEKIYDYYLNVHGRRGWDSLAQRTNAYVHSLILDNSGLTKDNAAYYPDDDDEYLAFGDGQSTFKPLASVDIVAHEYAHGINAHTSGFKGGGIILSFNEGLSDIWGSTIENYIAPQKDRWKIGEEVMLTKSCLRNISNPSDPTAYSQIANTYGTSDYNSPPVNQNTDYYRSGIISRWFYLLSEGGSRTNGLGNSYIVYGLGIETAARLVYFAQAGRRLNGTTTYPLMRTNMMSAADALYGANSFQSLQVANAWYAVGVGANPGQVTLSGPDLVCNSGSTFTANYPPSGSTISWDVTQSLLEVTSGGSTATPSIRAKSSSTAGFGKVVVKFTSNGFTTALPSKDVNAGGPVISGISGPTTTPNNQWATYYAVLETNLSAPTAYNWILNPINGNSVYNYGSTVDIAFYNPGTYQFVVQAKNACTGAGYGPYYVTGLSVYDALRISISPNPATGETTLKLVSENSDAPVALTEWDYEIYDLMQSLKEKKTKLKTAETKISTSNWKDGVYIVRAIVGEKIITEKLVVKH